MRTYERASGVLNLWLRERAVASCQLARQTGIDPVIAIILSVTVLHEPFDLLSAVGAVLILGAAFISEKS